MAIFLISSMVFKSSRSTDLLTVVSVRIARTFNTSGATQAVTLDIQGFWQGFICWSFSQTQCHRFPLFLGIANNFSSIFSHFSQLESDLWDNTDWSRKWVFDFNAGKKQLVLFDQSNNTGVIDVKMVGFVFEENHLLRCWVDFPF